jgi:acetyl-CoA carboxylase carboxyl transferase subunit alpha
LKALEERVGNLRRQVTAAMGAWQKTELARHPQRPYLLDYVSLMFDGFDEVHGDRRFGDDPAMICGMAKFRGQPVLVVGQQKGRDVKQRVYRNFGQSSPEGYRKALRAMRMAEKFGHPILTFVDTPGAFPGLGAEERGQAEAIAYNLREMARLKVPVIVTITGEGGSGGALAIAIGDRILMLENSIYSVISPEGCASIMWRDATKRGIAAEALRITAKDMVEFGVIDAVVPEPPGGAHRDPKAAADLLAAELHKQLSELQALSLEQLLAARYEKFRKMAQFYTEG